MASLLVSSLSELPATLQRLIGLLHPHCDVETAERHLASGPGLFEPARDHGVAMLLLDRWGDLLRAHLSADEFGAWRQFGYEALRQAAQQEYRAGQLLRALARADVDVVVMRGLWLSHAVYANPSQRAHGDVDLLVPLEQAEKAAEVLWALGYESFGWEPDFDWVRKELGNGWGVWLGNWGPPVGPRRADDNGPWTSGEEVWIDLHATLPGVAAGWWPYRPSSQWLLSRTCQWEFNDARVRAFVPHMGFLVQCEHLVRHGLGGHSQGARLVHLYDALLLARRFGEDDWRGLVEDAPQVRLHLHAATTVAALGRLWALPEAMRRATAFTRGKTATVLAQWALSRPPLLGSVGRAALFNACATGRFVSALEYVVRNTAGYGAFLRRQRQSRQSRQKPVMELDHEAQP